MDRVVVFVPGMSGKAHSGRFAWLDQVADDAGYASARVNVWADADELQTLTWQVVQERLVAVLSLLERQGFMDVVLVGKSFGGAVSLLCEHSLISKKILWSPAITCIEQAGNLTDLQTQPLGALEKTTDLSIDTVLASKITVPVKIIHGDADEVIAVENSNRLAAALADGEVNVIAGADHSFKAAAAAAELERLTADYLRV